MINEPYARVEGTGTINGAGDFGFLLTARDGAGKKRSNDVDEFRIKIWDMATGDVVYDNQMGAAHISDTRSVLGGGSIQIHG